jgi:hypothetical protein
MMVRKQVMMVRKQAMPVKQVMMVKRQKEKMIHSQDRTNFPFYDMQEKICECERYEPCQLANSLMIEIK